MDKCKMDTVCTCFTCLYNKLWNEHCAVVDSEKQRHFVIQGVFDKGVSGDDRVFASSRALAIDAFLARCPLELGACLSITISEVF